MCLQILIIAHFVEANYNLLNPIYKKCRRPPLVQKPLGIDDIFFYYNKSVYFNGYTEKLKKNNTHKFDKTPFDKKCET